MNYTYKEIWLINYPVMVSLLMEQLINITDTVFLGRTGETELGAAALASMFYTALYMLGFGFGLGMQVVISRKNGEEHFRETGRIFYQGFILLFALALFIFSISRAFSGLLLERLITSPDVCRAAEEYLRWRDYSYFFGFGLVAFRAFYIGTTRTRILTGNAVFMLLCNAVLNYLLVFGKGGFPPLGIAGAAVASSLSEGAALIFLIVYMSRSADKKEYGLSMRAGLCPEPEIARRLIRAGGWTMFRAAFTVGPWLLFFVAIEHLGKTQLAAANVVRSISMIFFVIVNSFATTGISLTGNLTGAGQEKEILPVCREIIGLAYLTGLPLVLFSFLHPDSIPGLFTNQPEVIRQAQGPFLVMLSTYLLSVPAYTFCNAVIGAGYVRTAFCFQVVTVFFYLVYLYELSGCREIPLALYWTSEQLYVLLLGGLSGIFLLRRPGRK